jgi:hypothetical protein
MRFVPDAHHAGLLRKIAEQQKQMVRRRIRQEFLHPVDRRGHVQGGMQDTGCFDCANQ